MTRTWGEWFIVGIMVVLLIFILIGKSKKVTEFEKATEFRESAKESTGFKVKIWADGVDTLIIYEGDSYSVADNAIWLKRKGQNNIMIPFCRIYKMEQF